MSKGKYIPFLDGEFPLIAPSKTNCLPTADLIASNISTLVLYFNEELSGMGLFRRRFINMKTTGDMYYLQSFQIQHDKFLCHHPYLPFHQKLIPQGDHLIKGCRYWRENRRFAPEAA